jgi:outer membrane protein
MKRIIAALVAVALTAPSLARAQDGGPSGQAPDLQLTLAQAIDMAVTNSPVVKAGADAVRSAQSRMEQAHSYKVPSLSVTGRYFYSNNLPGMFLQSAKQVPVMSSTGPVQGDFVTIRPMAPFPAQARDVLTTDLNLAYPIYTGGRITKANENAKKASEAATSDLKQQTSELVLNVTTAFDNVLLLKKVIAVNQQALDQFKAHYALAQTAYENGVRSEFDVLMFQSKVQEFVAKLVDLHGKLELAESGLKALLALPAGATVDCVGELVTADTLSPGDSSAVFSTALARNHEMQSLRIRRTMLENAKAIVSAERKPALFLFGNYHVYHGMDFPPYDNAWRNGLAFGVGLSMQVFDGNLTTGKIQEVNANEQMLEDHLAGMKIKLRTEITKVLITLHNLRARLAAEQVHLAVAEKAHDIAKVSYANGVITVVELNDSEVEVAAVQTAILNTQKDMTLAYARLVDLEGGDGVVHTTR